MNWAQAPSADDPLRHFANARARQAYVLIRLIDTGTLTRQQASRAHQQPLHLTHGGTGGCTVWPMPTQAGDSEWGGQGMNVSIWDVDDTIQATVRGGRAAGTLASVVYR
jgi:hypothetical protein